MVNHKEVPVFEPKQTYCAFCGRPSARLHPTLSFLWTLPVCPPLSFVARDGSNSFLTSSSCQCNGGVGGGAELPNPLLAINSLLYGCRNSSTEEI